MAQLKTASVLAFERKLANSDGLMYSGSWENRDKGRILVSADTPREINTGHHLKPPEKRHCLRPLEAQQRGPKTQFTNGWMWPSCRFNMTP